MKILKRSCSPSPLPFQRNSLPILSFVSLLTCITAFTLITSLSFLPLLLQLSIYSHSLFFPFLCRESRLISCSRGLIFVKGWGGGRAGRGSFDNYFLYVEPAQRINGYYPSMSWRKGAKDRAVIVESQRDAAVFEYVGQRGDTADNRPIHAQLLGGGTSPPQVQENTTKEMRCL